MQTCIDVAQSSQPTSIGNSETASLGSMMSLHSRSSGIGNILAFNEDEAFKIILRKKLIDDPLNIPDSRDYSASDNSDQEQKPSEQEEKVSGTTENKSEEERKGIAQSTLGNSLNRRMGWSFDDTHKEDDEEEEKVASPREVPIEESLKSSEHSYNALIQSYSMFGGAYVKTPDFREVWERFENKDLANSPNIPTTAAPVGKIINSV